MKSARRKRRPFWLFVFPLVAAVFLFKIFHTNLWNSDQSLNLAIATEDGVVVSVFDPMAKTISNIIIPKDVEVSVSRELGIWRLGAVWKLGENEHLGGKLLKETLIKTFGIPVDAWADSVALEFSQRSLFSLANAIFVNSNTNLSFGDRLSIAIFSLTVKNTDRVNIDLIETGYLVKTKLADGESGYRAKGRVPPRVAATFSDFLLSKEGSRAIIFDATGDGSEASQIATLVEVLGAKIVSIQKVGQEDFDCLLAGKSHDRSVERIARLFDCKIGETKPENFDIEIRIGKEFAKRF